MENETEHDDDIQRSQYLKRITRRCYIYESAILYGAGSRRYRPGNLEFHWPHSKRCCCWMGWMTDPHYGARRCCFMAPLEY